MTEQRFLALGTQALSHFAHSLSSPTPPKFHVIAQNRLAGILIGVVAG